jgi:hypothetical protein
MATAHFIGLIDEYKSAHGVSDAELARRIGVTRQNLGLWRESGLRALPAQVNLKAVATAIRRPYRQVLDAALRDVGYLTDADADEPRSYGEVLADAIRSLTEAVRLTNQPMRQGVSGEWEPDPNGTPQRIDWAAFVAVAVAAAAANAGGVEEALAGRGGSWEAERVRQLLHSTVGGDAEFLWEHRTDPVRITLHVENIIGDYAPDAEAQYYDAARELADRYAAIGIPTVTVSANSDPGWQERLAALPPATPEQEATADKIADLENQIDEQRSREWATYGRILKDKVERRLAELLPQSIPVNVTIDPGYNPDWRSPVHRATTLDQVIDAVIATTMSPANLPGTPLERLETNHGDAGPGDDGPG